MIKIISDEINDFIELLQTEYSNDAPFYLHICEGCDSVQDPYTEKLAFGMFNRETNHCYVAGDLEEEQVLKTIAHEYKHYTQKCSSVEFDEDDAENFADYMYDKFMCEIRKTIEDCGDCGFCKKGDKE